MISNLSKEAWSRQRLTDLEELLFDDRQKYLLVVKELGQDAANKMFGHNFLKYWNIKRRTRQALMLLALGVALGLLIQEIWKG